MILQIVMMNKRSTYSITFAATLVYSIFAFSFIQASAGINSTNPIPRAAPIATSGDNVYIAWWLNKTGNDEVMFKASADGGKTFGDIMNLSNSTNAESQDAQIAASGSNVYITWWERNQTSDKPVMIVSNDNGKSFGERIMLSAVN
jgi:hypothetical protein